MLSSRIPSPAHSQGAKSTPRRHKPRASRSVGSPARSTSSVKLTTVLQMDSFALSPMPSRRSVLTDTTDIDIPKRKSWWRKLDENSREIMEVLNNKDPAEANNAIEEYIEVDVLSQEKKNYTMDIPESSDAESISSIVIPQRKLFTQKESKTQKNFAQMIDNRESLAPLHKTQEDNDKIVNVGRKNIFGQGTKRRTKPLFPSALLNISANKTIANKTKELAAAEPKAQVKSLFGNRPGEKRKNMFADFILSDSDDEISEIQPKVFEFQKKPDQKRRRSLNTRRESHITSPTSSMTDIEIDDWRLLPSSTMVDHQLEDGLRTTPSKRARLGKLSEATETINTESNTTTNKTKQSNKLLHSKSKSKNASQLKEMEDNELIDPKTTISRLDTVKENNKSTTKNLSREHSLQEQMLKNKEQNKSKNVSVIKIVNEVTCEVNVLEDKNAKTNRKSYSKSLKTLSKIDQVFQSDDDEDFNLVYENDDNIEIENEGSRTKIVTEVEGPKETSNISKLSVPENVNVTKQLQNKSKSQNILHQEKRQIDDEDLIKQLRDKSNNTSLNNLQSTNKKQCQASQLENEVDQIIHKEQNSLKHNKISNCEMEKIREVQNNQDRIDIHEPNQECCSDNTEINNKQDDDGIDDINDQKGQDVENDQNPIGEVYKVDCNKDITQENQNSSIQQEDEEEETNDNNGNISQEERSNNGDITEEEIEEELQYSDEEESENDEKIDDQDDEEETSDIRDLEVEQEIEKNETEDDNKSLNEEVTQNEKRNDKVEQNQLPLDEVDNKIMHYENKDISNNQGNYDEKGRSNATLKNKKANVTGNSAYRHGQKLDANVASPEAILHYKPSQMESFTVQGRNTSERKTKSIIKNFTIRQSLVPVRESIDSSYGSRNSSVEGSGWDSHRTTRATLRQTFGKDFTPTQSLRTLVMEKCAKRRTNFTDNNAEISRLPQANSTEFPESTPFAMNQSNDEVSRNKSDDAHIADNSGGAQKEDKSDRDMSHVNESDDSKEIPETNHDSSPEDDNDLETSKVTESQEMDDSNQEMSHNMDDFDEDPKNNESDQEQRLNESDADHETNESDLVVLREVNESDEASNRNESDQEVSREADDSDGAQYDDECENVHEMNESDDGHETDESEQEMTRDDEDEEINEADNSQEINQSSQMNESDDGHETDESEQEMTRDDEDEEINEADNSQEINQSSHEVSGEINDADEESKMDVVQEMDESEIAQEMNESNEAQDINEFDDEQNMNESDDERDVNESEDVHEMNDSDHELSSNKDNQEEVQEMEYGHEESKKTGQTTLEMYLQKIKRQNIQRKKQLEKEVRNSLKTPTRDMLNPFKVPAVPKLRRINAQQIKSKGKPVKSSVPLNMLPAEVLEDMKYKPPKRYRPTNASWITKRLYKFLETKLEPKYDYKARVRSEKLVETIYNFTKDIRRHDTAPPAAVHALKHEMARLDVVKTHFEFYEFFHEYMPREVRVKVVPDVFNKISLPKYGVFSDILR